ncbi:MAG: hypothetical protein KG003_00960, partial [Bacteroidetes bacterium]|nr:hypothetical protein [Bacteroidota bacterium]
MAASYVPLKKSAFSVFEINLLTIVVANAGAWGILPADVTDLQALQTAFQNAWAISQVSQTATPTDRQTTNLAMAEYVTAIRAFVKQWLKYNPAITPAEMTSMGVTINSTTRHHEPVPAFPPIVSVQP